MLLATSPSIAAQRLSSSIDPNSLIMRILVPSHCSARSGNWIFAQSAKSSNLFQTIFRVHFPLQLQRTDTKQITKKKTKKTKKGGHNTFGLFWKPIQCYVMLCLFFMGILAFFISIPFLSLSRMMVLANYFSTPTMKTYVPNLDQTPPHIYTTPPHYQTPSSRHQCDVNLCTLQCGHPSYTVGNEVYIETETTLITPWDDRCNWGKNLEATYMRKNSLYEGGYIFL